ncbi:hypothetical protein AB1A65_08570 [Muricauda sp. ANG21]|uniref:hypothetical protein n=1 Tax=Allomuricauda sp. ANG21 TaxID=3042468 RepID=UPI003453637B
MLNSLSFFNYKNVEIENSEEIEKLVKTTFPDISVDTVPIDILYTDAMDVSKFVELLSKGKFHNDSMVLICGIHQDREKQNEWENLVVLPHITVSIDMFHCGAIFIRQEQEKEHFTIRI